MPKHSFPLFSHRSLLSFALSRKKYKFSSWRGFLPIAQCPCPRLSISGCRLSLRDFAILWQLIGQLSASDEPTRGEVHLLSHASFCEFRALSVEAECRFWASSWLFFLSRSVGVSIGPLAVPSLSVCSVSRESSRNAGCKFVAVGRGS